MASSSSSASTGDETPHVLAVDDSLLDRKLIEKLLTNSSCKGTYIYHVFLIISFFFFVFSNFLFFVLIVYIDTFL
jgi:hypothetical protein